MAVTTSAQESKLRMKFDDGLDTDGKTIVKSKTYSKLKATAVNDDVYGVATSLGSLQENPVLSIRRIDEAELVEE